MSQYSRPFSLSKLIHNRSTTLARRAMIRLTSTRMPTLAASPDGVLHYHWEECCHFQTQVLNARSGGTRS